jgi:NMD protein affecting ribosome stability and mRNA decay
MPRHCPSCNRSESDAKFYGEFCEFCSRDKLVAKLPESVTMKFCRKCGRVWNGRGFKEPDGRALEEAVGLRIKGYILHLIDFDGDTIKLDIGEQRKEGILAVERILSIKREKALCDDCNKASSGYYEATIQLRGNPEKVEKMKERIIRYVKKSRAFIAKIGEADNGVDIFISDKNVVTELMLHMRLKPTISYTLYGEKRGNRVYRNTYALHL